MPPVRRQDLARWGAPFAFLAAVTILVVLVHSALSGGGGETTSSARVTTTQAPTATTTAPNTTETEPKPPKRFYTVRAGDTFGTIAARFGTTVEHIAELNPGVESTSLTIGQRVRVE